MPNLIISTLSLFALATKVLADDTSFAISGTELTANPSGVVLVGATVTTPPSNDRANIANPPKYLTISVINSHGSPLSTVHVKDPHAPSAVSGNVGAGTMAKGATAAFAVPTNWIGNVAFNEASKKITGDDTLIEANFKVPSGYKVAVADVDVSYVNGFSVPITCSCKNSGVVTGCNKNLFKLNKCNTSNGQGECKNPLRSDSGATSAAPFFAPCQHAAWTYVNDGAADAWGRCQSGHITCCVGTSCPANPKQPK